MDMPLIAGSWEIVFNINKEKAGFERKVSAIIVNDSLGF